MPYVKSDFPRGRPRLGEVRELTPNAIYHKRWERKRKSIDPAFKLQLAIYQQFWRLANLERSNEISRASGERRRRRIGIQPRT